MPRRFFEVKRMKTISIDIETFSDINLAKCGVYKYAESPAFEILLFGYSVDGGEVQVVDLAQVVGVIAPSGRRVGDHFVGREINYVLVVALNLVGCGAQDGLGGRSGNQDVPGFVGGHRGDGRDREDGL